MNCSSACSSRPLTRQSWNARQTPTARFVIHKPTTSAGPTAPTQALCRGGALWRPLRSATLQSTIVVALLTPAALTVHSLALGTVLEWRPLRSVALQSTVVVALLTPAALTVHSLALGAAIERPPGPAFGAAGRQPPRRPLVPPSVCCTMRAGCWCRVPAALAVRSLLPIRRLVRL